MSKSQAFWFSHAEVLQRIPVDGPSFEKSAIVSQLRQGLRSQGIMSYFPFWRKRMRRVALAEGVVVLFLRNVGTQVDGTSLPGSRVLDNTTLLAGRIYFPSSS